MRIAPGFAFGLFGLALGLFSVGCRTISEPLPPGEAVSPLLVPVAAPLDGEVDGEDGEVDGEDGGVDGEDGEVDGESDAQGADATGSAGPQPWRPEPGDRVDWVLLKSGEWLKGTIEAFDGDNLTFDSRILEDLEIDWADVVEVLSKRTFTLLLSDRTTVYGRLAVDQERVRITGAEETFELERADLMRLIPGLPEESNYWSGDLRLSAAAASGNTDQTNASFYAATRRQTAASRLDLSVDAVVGSQNGDENINNQTLRARHDLYLSPRFYLTPLGAEMFSDRFQNIDWRATPYTGLGYQLIDRPGLEWEANAGLGYRATRFESVPAGEDQRVGSGTLVLGTNWERDLTARIELGFDYEAQIGLEDLQDTNQNASALLSLDFLWGLEFDFRVVWKWVGDPARGADGEKPEKDDLRLELGFSWDF